MWSATAPTEDSEAHFQHLGDQGALQVMGDKAQIHTLEKTKESLHLHPLPSDGGTS